MQRSRAGLYGAALQSPRSSDVSASLQRLAFRAAMVVTHWPQAAVVLLLRQLPENSAAHLLVVSLERHKPVDWWRKEPASLAQC